MHLLMFFSAFTLAWLARASVPVVIGLEGNQWAKSLFFFLFSPILISMTAIAVLCMGYQGKMLGIEAGWLSYTIAIIFCLLAAFNLLKQIRLACLSYLQICCFPEKNILEKKARILPTLFPYIAQIGFWKPELVISQGLLNILDEPHLQAVLAHEQAHADYHDPFWFFCLNWLKSITFWLPNTQILWQELSLLREIRADQKAKQSIDSLLLAESLLQVVVETNQSQPLDIIKDFAMAFHTTLPHHRLEERINCILDKNTRNFQIPWCVWGIIFCSLLPLFTLPLHSFS